MGDLALFGHDLFGDPVQPAQAPLASRFTFPPFTILDGRSGDWQDRKAGWIALGIESELGRDVEVFDQSRLNSLMGYNNAFKTGTSVFDPVVCELAYRWFCPPGGQVVDPFAGGSVRGVVASLLGRKYWGSDLSSDQVAANREQADAICDENLPRWVCGDSTTLLTSSPPADFIFSCPPYGDLERYSDDPRDLSAMDYPAFLEGYKRIIGGCFDRLRDDRFACFVVGEFRDKKTGNYRGFVADTIAAFQECGFHYYNEAILLTPTGSLPVRAGKTFEASRKLGKAHQNILVFLKGNARAATASAGEP